MLSMHVFLIGMAGAGKSSLGKRLATGVGAPFVDTDQRVSMMIGLSLGQIFEQMGEEFFRNAETGALIELAGVQPCVVATGGGTAMNAENVRIMKNHGIIVHIDRPLDQILSDIKMDRRPNLAGGSYEDVIMLYNQRIGHYRAAADYRLDNSMGYAMGATNLVSLVSGIPGLCIPGRSV